jgi:hypothetical protein
MSTATQIQERTSQVVSAVPVAAKWYQQGPASFSERRRFFVHVDESNPLPGASVTTKCQAWIGGCDGRGVPQVRFRGAIRTASQVYAFIKYGEAPADGSKVSFCGNPKCLEHRKASRASETAASLPVKLYDALPNELRDWEDFEVKRADEVGCTSTMMCYACGGEFTPGNKVRTTGVEGLTTQTVKVFDPCATYNDTLCDMCFGPGVPETKGTHFERVFQIQRSINNYVEDALIAAIDFKKGGR